ncbi:STAS domain-containing protein [Nonomuraea purpurea]|uniref:STAS domain-containing protein n=1 Tax=Nonomuraea purpurea TaxID=1849276 RepID=A0ABV8GJH1_9ACTN
MNDTPSATAQLLYVDHQLRIVCHPMPGPSILRLVGEIDATNSQALADTLAQARRIDEAFILDTGELTFIGISGARELIAFCEGGPTRLESVPPLLLRLLLMLGPPAAGRPQRAG